MSFNFEFVAEREDASQIIGEEHAPIAVKDFLTAGLAAFKPDSLVHVKAVGHLFNSDYQTSTGQLVVEQVVVRKPKAPSS
jgi:hypothetical protein